MDWLCIPVGRARTERLKELGKRAWGQMDRSESEVLIVGQRDKIRAGYRGTLRLNGQFLPVLFFLKKKRLNYRINRSDNTFVFA